MANPTSNFGWQMPTATDLVTDLPADFEVFGQAVDTDFVDLLGGTTGQILSKTSATDLDFTWINNDQGDITAVTAGTGITGGGTSGAVTVTNDMATTITTNGDLLYGTGSGTYTRRGIGSTSQVLTVAGGVPTWATPAAGGAYTLLSTTTLSSSNQVISSIDQTYKHLFVTIQNMTNATGNGGLRIDANSNASSAYYTRIGGDNATFSSGATQAGQLSLTSANLILRTSTQNQTTIMYYNYAEANLHPFQVIETYQNDTNNYTYGAAFGTIAFGTAAAISSIRFNNYGGAFTAGTVKIYGVN